MLTIILATAGFDAWIVVGVGALLLGILMVVEMGLVLGSKYFQVPAAEAVITAGVSNTKSIGALMFIEPVELPVDKGTQKVAFAELDHAFAIACAGEIAAVESQHVASLKMKSVS